MSIEQEIRGRVKEVAEKLRSEHVEGEVEELAVVFEEGKDGFIKVTNGGGEYFGVIGYMEEWKSYAFRDKSGNVYAEGFLGIVVEKLIKMRREKEHGTRT